ncbi:INO80 complex, subunit Ies4 [Clohesyomyces aquaticus]|uniref:INO80 complex, subunit Ies4 n=1 Tax=Clohesyomyces aquaticus TaxID=1231657 RepID=A0A1Y2A2M7_9PLEO|nr:INO80 complex, subunit Ies4 [Clohesyomyces aquaticus]
MPPATPKTKTVTLRLSPDVLANFPHEPSLSRKPSQSRSKSTSSSTEAPAIPVIEQPPTPSENPSESATTPAVNGTTTPSSSLAPPAAGAKRKGIPGPKPGTKRGASALAPDGLPKPRGKPGPKKKQRMGDVLNDPLAKNTFAAPAPVQKLGPKANQGAINAGLRALDRTGKPCRKWEKKVFSVKSFTGVQWTVPTWRAPKRSAAFSEDVTSDTTGSSDSKIKDGSSAVSDSNGGAVTPMPPPAPVNGVMSSPPPVATAS